MSDPVLVIMAKQPAVGRTKTRLSPPLTPAEAAALYEAMLRDTIQLGARLEGVRLAIAVTPPEATSTFRRFGPPGTILLPVAGVDIGDCLNQVLGRLLAAGHPQVIALNSDGPTLPDAYLRPAFAWLDADNAAAGRRRPGSGRQRPADNKRPADSKHPADNQHPGADVVLGPSEDGGYYLIGLKQACPELFRDIEWSSERVTAQTLARAQAMGLSVALLPPWYDVDTSADLARLQGELATLPAEALPHTRRFFARRRQSAPGPSAPPLAGHADQVKST